jgi:ABC-type sugar transport system substrate-binding protein
MAGLLRCLVPAVLCAGLSSSACAGDLRVGFVNPGQPPEFWNLVTTTMRAAATQFGVQVDVRETGRSRDKAIALAKEFLALRPPLDYLIATNDVDAGGEIIKLADAAGVKLLLLNNDLDRKDWAAYGEPRTRYRNWLGSITPDHESGGYGIAAAVLAEAAKRKSNRPLRLLALSGDATTPASVERVRGMKRAVEVMAKLLGPNSVALVDVRYLDWSAKTAEASVRDFTRAGPRIDALWAANDPMALGALAALRAGGYKPGEDVFVGGLNWSQDAVARVLGREMVITHGGHFLVGAWAMVLLRDYHDGRDFAEEDVRLQFPMGAVDLSVARRFADIGSVDWRRVGFAKFSKTRSPGLRRYEFTPDAVLGQLRSAAR